MRGGGGRAAKYACRLWVRVAASCTPATAEGTFCAPVCVCVRVRVLRGRILLTRRAGHMALQSQSQFPWPGSADARLAYRACRAHARAVGAARLLECTAAGRSGAQLIQQRQQRGQQHHEDHRLSHRRQFDLPHHRKAEVSTRRSGPRSGHAFVGHAARRSRPPAGAPAARWRVHAAMCQQRSRNSHAMSQAATWGDGPASCVRSIACTQEVVYTGCCERINVRDQICVRWERDRTS